MRKLHMVSNVFEYRLGINLSQPENSPIAASYLKTLGMQLPEKKMQQQLVDSV